MLTTFTQADEGVAALLATALRPWTLISLMLLLPFSVMALKMSIAYVRLVRDGSFVAQSDAPEPQPQPQADDDEQQPIESQQHTKRFAWCHSCRAWLSGVPGDRCPDCGRYLVVNPLADDWKPRKQPRRPARDDTRQSSSNGSTTYQASAAAVVWTAEELARLSAMQQEWRAIVDARLRGK